MARVVIFGTADTASLAHYYFRKDSEHQVVGFALTSEFLTDKEFEGLPVVDFDRVQDVFPPGDHCFFAPMTARNHNKDREAVYRAIKEKGYGLVSYVSSRATVFDNVQIGENCFILEDNTVQPFVKIGNDVVLWSGNHIGHHSVIHDHVFFTSHVVLSGHCTVGPYAFFGVNSTIRDALHIAEGTIVGMGAVVVRDTEPYGVYKGNPARKDLPKPTLSEEKTAPRERQ